MEFVPVQELDLTIGQPLPWDLFDQEYKPLFKSGYVIKTVEELKELAAQSIFRGRVASSKIKQSKIDNTRTNTFEEMQLKVGDKLQIRSVAMVKSNKSTTKNDYATVMLIGYIHDKTFLTSIPQSTYFKGSPLIEGDEVMVRYFSGESLFSFNVFVEKNIYQPFKYIHLSFPRAISSQTIRKSKRVKSNIKATINNGTTEAIITNISSTGAKIRSDTDLGRSGTLITLSFSTEIHGQQSEIVTRATIRSFNYITENNKANLYFGVEFAELKPDQVVTLQSLVYQELVENRSIV